MTTNEMVDIIKSRNPNATEITPCKECDSALEIKVIREDKTYEIIPANLPHALFIIQDIKEKKVLPNDGEITILSRCVCFTVTDPNGTRIECYICEEGPVVRCFGPYPYCPTLRSIFSIEDDITDGSEVYIKLFSKTSSYPSGCPYNREQYL